MGNSKASPPSLLRCSLKPLTAHTACMQSAADAAKANATATLFA